MRVSAAAVTADAVGRLARRARFGETLIHEHRDWAGGNLIVQVDRERARPPQRPQHLAELVLLRPI